MTIDHVPSLPETPLPPASADTAPAAPGVADDLLASAHAFVRSLDAWPAVMHQLGDADLTALAAVMLQLSRRAETITAVATIDAAERGTIAQSTAASITHWVRALPPGITRHQARAIAELAGASRDNRNHAITAAVRDGLVSGTTAATALREAAKITPLFPTVERSEIHSWYLALDDPTPHTLRALTRRVIAAFGDHTLADDEEHHQQVETLTWQELPTGMIDSSQTCHQHTQRSSKKPSPPPAHHTRHPTRLLPHPPPEHRSDGLTLLLLHTPTPLTGPTRGLTQHHDHTPEQPEHRTSRLTLPSRHPLTRPRSGPTKPMPPRTTHRAAPTTAPSRPPRHAIPAPRANVASTHSWT